MISIYLMARMDSVAVLSRMDSLAVDYDGRVFTHCLGYSKQDGLQFCIWQWVQVGDALKDSWVCIACWAPLWQQFQRSES